jgi:hypothetical protein
MSSTQLPWGPREGKILCIIELDLQQDIDRGTISLDDVLRVSIAYCSASVWKERSLVDPRPSPPAQPSKDRRSSAGESLDGNRGMNQWHPRVEVIPPTTLFTEPNNPGVKINLALPPEIADELRNQFQQKWLELMADMKQYGIHSFRELYDKPASPFHVATGSFWAGPPINDEHPLRRWWPPAPLICYKNAARRNSQHCQ